MGLATREDSETEIVAVVFGRRKGGFFVVC